MQCMNSVHVHLRNHLCVLRQSALNIYFESLFPIVQSCESCTMSSARWWVAKTTKNHLSSFLPWISADSRTEIDSLKQDSRWSVKNKRNQSPSRRCHFSVLTKLSDSKKLYFRLSSSHKWNINLCRDTPTKVFWCSIKQVENRKANNIIAEQWKVSRILFSSSLTFSCVISSLLSHSMLAFREHSNN